VCRPGDKAKATLKGIAAMAGEENVELITADLAETASVRACAGEFIKNHDRLDILVNNAGVFLPDRHETGEGLERTFATNHLAYFLLTNLLLDMLKSSQSARVVCVASEAERWGKIDFDDLQFKRHYSGMKAYAQSKLANIIFTYELARRLIATSVTANCLHPGTVRTGWGQNAKGLFKIGMKLFGPFMISPEEGAKTSIYLASSPEVEGITGRYFIKCRPAKSVKSSFDPGIAKKLWEVSGHLTGIS
jgi:NAD(P)-dependent dehydrogenase (short-subunit alcohol dehydrogenase family)